jgi:hypothetical protein
MNLTIGTGNKVHHPPVLKGDVFLCGSVRGYTPHGGHAEPTPVNKEVDCLECLYVLKRMTSKQMSDSGITFRVVVSVLVDGRKKTHPTFYFSSLTTPEIRTTEDAVNAARRMFSVDMYNSTPGVSWDVRAVRLSK